MSKKSPIIYWIKKIAIVTGLSILGLILLLVLIFLVVQSYKFLKKDATGCLDIGQILGTNIEDQCYKYFVKYSGETRICAFIENDDMSDKCYGIQITDPPFTIDQTKVSEVVSGHRYENFTISDMRWKQAELVQTQCGDAVVDFIVVYEAPLTQYCPTYIALGNSTVGIAEYEACSSTGSWSYQGASNEAIWEAWQDVLRRRGLLESYLEECYQGNEMKVLKGVKFPMISVKQVRGYVPENCDWVDVRLYLDKEYRPLGGLKRDLDGNCAIY